MTVTPPKFPKNTQRLLFGETAFTFGQVTFTFGGNKVYSRGFSKILGVWDFPFCCLRRGGGLGLCGSGGPVGVSKRGKTN